MFVAERETGKVISKKPWFVKFFAPWCGHCNHMEPAWREFLDKNEKSVNVASVDCTSEYGSLLCQEYGISGYPTLLFFPAE